MQLKELFGFISDVAGALGAVFAFFAWLVSLRTSREMRRERERLNEKVSIVVKLHGDDKQIELPISMRRADIARTEILGRLGMLPMRENGKRFSLRHVGTQDFIVDIDRVYQGREKVIVIPCDDNELSQFDL